MGTEEYGHPAPEDQVDGGKCLNVPSFCS